MDKIVIIGAGGLAREVKNLIDNINIGKLTFEFLGYLVSDLDKLGEYDSKDEVIGDFSWFKEQTHVINVAIGIGNPKSRLNVVNKLLTNYSQLVFPSLIHPSVIYDKNSVTIEQGVIICASTVMTVNIMVQEFSFINLCCTVGHDAFIGRGSVLNPTVNISGGVSLGDGVLVGTGSQILQYVSVGSNSVIGAGACVTKQLPSNIVAVGVPAKAIKTIDE